MRIYLWQNFEQVIVLRNSNSYEIYKFNKTSSTGKKMGRSQN